MTIPVLAVVLALALADINGGLLALNDETMAAVTVEAGSALVGGTVGDVEIVVVTAVRPAAGSVQPIPLQAYSFRAGDLVSLVGRPDALCRFDADAIGGESRETSGAGNISPTEAEATDTADDGDEGTQRS